jgi:hypothetical protein
VAGVAGLHDPARELVHAVPVAAWLRLAHRLALLAPAVVVVVAAHEVAGRAWFGADSASPSVQELSAVGALGLCGAACLTRKLGARAVDTTVSCLAVWAAASAQLVAAGVPGWLAEPWVRWPWQLAAAGTAVALVASSAGLEA